MRARPIAEQIAGQCRATMAMLPYASVSGLGELSAEILATIFGQTMRIRNALPDLHHFAVEATIQELEQPRIRIETQREYWRRKQREHRAKNKEASFS